ncbi:N-acetylmuramoyl-L-alanine amidase [Streptomyces thermolilacinus]|uniref:N-acetylmuramoyl-L-alanine amidase n=1 Tax=Streptomyces thermolilacinus SPC6 TaxID=1306406 RepID=A0A1D3DW96_9ACTN|nr:N-acetylmuramoyl-L-alanine amidase [Streptomyces thermolilacinus]OEJ96600.1 N-acetylmuramoyl-L-alanine amidase [Streptomyces thermolilacinus SPC6]
MSAGHRRDRKKRKLLIYGIASAVAAAMTAGTLAVASPDFLGSSDAKAVPPAAELQAEFEEAAREFDVPKSVLMAVSYRQTRWESHDGLPSTTGAYNVMGLTQVNPEDLEDGHAGEDDDHRLAHMNRSGDPNIEKHFDAEKALKSVRKKPVDTSDPRLHTLDEAAELIDASPDAVREDPAQSIRAGAALLAEYQRQATGSLPDDPGKWYPAVARYSQAPDRKGAQLFAKRVFESIRTGERRITNDGQQLSLPADPSVKPVQSKVPLAMTSASTTAVPTPDCPAGLNCDFRPAAYKQNSGPDDWGNYNIASRPAGGHDIRYIAIHDTEGSYDGSLAVFQNSNTYASAHYMVRASDGLVTQMVENKNEAWHAGNKTLNMHSIGIEHEGYAIKEGSWYTEPQYESSAALVKHLAAKYDIPLDREHIIGHDEIPGVLDTKVRAQHWDPGPFWDWNHYMSLMGAPTGAGGAGGPLKAGQLVRVVPPFTTANQPKLTNNGSAVPAQPANFGYLYTSPSTSSATISDPYLGAQSWSEGWNWANKIVAGGTWVVAEAQNNWTAIWYGGQKAWFYNPGGQYTAPVGTGTVVRAKAGATVRVYGRSYPDDAAYAGTGVPVQDQNSAHLTKYSLPAGQTYTLAGDAVPGTYYYGGTIDGTGTGSRTLVQGSNLFYPIRYNHRFAWVSAADVEKVTSTAPDPGTNRYNTLARDASGVLWQYQGTGNAASPFFTRYRVGSGWGAYNMITSMTALRADGTGDAVARDGSGGLWYYQGSGNPSAPFKARLYVGKGWQIYNLMSGARDLSGDGIADLVARDGSGYLWFYAGTGNPAAPFKARTSIGRGWQIYDSMTDTGDVTGDGKPDMVARDTSGVLWLYQGTGSATAPFAARTTIGKGWQIYNTLLGPSDLNRDGQPDLIARDANGHMWFYQGRGSTTAPFVTRTSIGSGWQIYNLFV